MALRDLAPRDLRRSSVAQRATELERKRAAWGLLVPARSAYLRKEVEWYQSDEACAVLLPRLLGPPRKRAPAIAQRGGLGDDAFKNTVRALMFISDQPTAALTDPPPSVACADENGVDGDVVQEGWIKELEYRKKRGASGSGSDREGEGGANESRGGSLADLVPKSLASMSERGKAAELVRKRLAWAKLVPPRSPFLRQTLEWFQSNEACSAAVPRVLQRGGGWLGRCLFPSGTIAPEKNEAVVVSDDIDQLEKRARAIFDDNDVAAFAPAMLAVENAHATRIMGGDACVNVHNLLHFYSALLATFTDSSTPLYDALADFRERMGTRHSLYLKHCRAMQRWPCDPIKINQNSGTCWLNTYINGVIISDGAKRVYAKVILDYLATAPNDVKNAIQNASVTACPSSGAGADAKRVTLYGVLYQAICSLEKAGRNTDVLAAWAPKTVWEDPMWLIYNVFGMYENVKDVVRLLSPAVANYSIISSYVPHERMTQSMPPQVHIVMFDLKWDSNGCDLLTKLCTGDHFDLPETISFAQSNAFQRQFVGIMIEFSNSRERHVVAGVECRGRRFVYDSNGITYDVDWLAPDYASQLMPKLKAYKFYASVSYVGISYVVYAQQSAIMLASKIPGCTFLSVPAGAGDTVSS